MIEACYGKFLTVLSEMTDKYNVNIYAYCLMKNHYHLLIQTPDANLDKAMKYFGETFARFINGVSNGFGPVFSGRYHSKIICDEQYLLEVFRYIHLNPLDAKLVENFSEYKWSSIVDYINDDFSIVNPSFMKQYFMDINDLLSYHYLGNSKKINSFYSRQKIPNRISHKSIGKPSNLV